jgi:hypothetical protein
METVQNNLNIVCVRKGLVLWGVGGWVVVVVGRRSRWSVLQLMPSLRGKYAHFYRRRPQESFGVKTRTQ